jgi:hypothetical protein
MEFLQPRREQRAPLARGFIAEKGRVGEGIRWLQAMGF